MEFFYLLTICFFTSATNYGIITNKLIKETHNKLCLFNILNKKKGENRMSIIVYTKNGCSKCDLSKAVLNGEGIIFSSVNIEDDTPQGRDAFDYIVNVLELRSMPVIVKNDEVVMVGEFNPDKLKALKD